MNLPLLLDVVQWGSNWLFALSPVWFYTLLGSLLAATLAAAGMVLARLRLSPLWALMVLVPFGAVLGLWWLALRRPQPPVS